MCGAVIFRKFFLEKVRLIQINASPVGIANRKEMSDEDELQPGDRSPVTAHYEELNVFGSPTGTVVQVREVERLPSAPRGFTWRIRREDR